MSAILAIFNRRGQPVEPQIVDKMLAARPEHSQDGTDKWIAGPIALAHQHFYVTPEEVGERQPIQDGLTSHVITCDARIDNRQELFDALHLSPSSSFALSDATFILKAYTQWGEACVDHLLGDYAFVIWDSSKKCLFGARDPLGARNLVYFCTEHVCIIASEIAVIQAHPSAPNRINEAKIAEDLAGLYHNLSETLFEEIYYCPPGNCMIVSQDQMRLRKYWDIDPGKKIRYRVDRDYAEHFLMLLKDAVNCRLRSTGKIGIALSGGLDSSSVAALAAHQITTNAASPQKLLSFSYIFDVLKQCDEREFIRPLVERYEIEPHYLLCDDQWTLKEAASWPILHDFLVADSVARLIEKVKQEAAQSGCRILLSGNYGDVLFASREHWLGDMVRDLRLLDIVRTLSTHRSAINWRSELFENGLHQLIPISLKKIYRRWRPREAFQNRPWLHPDLIERTGLRQRALSDERWKKFTNSSRWDFYQILMANFHSESLSAVRSSYHVLGLELLSPYFDCRLVEFLMAIPADQLGRPWRTKYILRNAMQEKLPEIIRDRLGKTSYYPLVELGLREKERETVLKILDNSRIVRDRFIRGDWLNKELHAQNWSRDGFDLWICITLELWLKHYS
jgi:asparagine synthase (glutamine-hydrolysing)